MWFYKILNWINHLVSGIQNIFFAKSLNPVHYQEMVKMGKFLLQNNKYDQATSMYKECISRFPGEPGGYHGMAECAKSKWQRENVDAWLDRSIIKTGHESSYRMRINLLVKHGQYQEGFSLLEELMKKKGVTEDKLIFKAQMLFIPGKFMEAANILMDVRSTAETQILLARALIGANRNEEANEVIQSIDFSREKNEMEKQTLQLLQCWQKNYEKGAGYELPKIFGIGLSRTGTTSLTHALNILGFGALHFINPLTSQIINDMDYRFFDAFTDSPVSYRFENLYTLYPNAKFIYTDRDLDDWVYSSSRLYKPWGVKTTKEFRSWLDLNRKGKFVKNYHNYDPVYQKAYRSLYADFPDWKTAFLAFEERVHQFFDGKPQGKLLKINICEQPEWDTLCNFLGVDMPDIPFPHTNKMPW